MWKVKHLSKSIKQSVQSCAYLQRIVGKNLSSDLCQLCFLGLINFTKSQLPHLLKGDSYAYVFNVDTWLEKENMLCIEIEAYYIIYRKNLKLFSPLFTQMSLHMSIWIKIRTGDMTSNNTYLTKSHLVFQALKNINSIVNISIQ